jgi:pimeloyl-ACP methyl ester carboxylesterase
VRAKWLRRLLALVAFVAGWLALGALYQSIASTRVMSRFPPPGQLIDIGGRRLHIRCEGTGSPAVIFEHTGLGNTTSWDSILPRVAERTRACAYDRAGMGWSDNAGQPLSADRLARDLETLLERAGIPPPYVLVPGSIGGITAEPFARRHADRIAGLVWVDAVSSEVLRRTPEIFKGFKRETCLGRWVAQFGLLRLADPFGIGDDERTAALTYKTSTWSSLCSLLGSLDDSADQLAAAPSLRSDLRLTVLVAERPDGLFPPGQEERGRQLQSRWREAQRAFAGLSSRGCVKMVPNSGHLIMEDQPVAVATSVLAVVAADPASPALSDCGAPP